MTKLQRQLIQRISETENEHILLEIQRLLKMEDETSPEILSQEQIREIELSRLEIQEGHFVTNEEADHEIVEWLRNP